MNDHARERRHAPIPWHPMSDAQLAAERKASARISIFSGNVVKRAKADGDWHLYWYARTCQADANARWMEFTTAGGVDMDGEA